MTASIRGRVIQETMEFSDKRGGLSLKSQRSPCPMIYLVVESLADVIQMGRPK